MELKGRPKECYVIVYGSSVHTCTGVEVDANQEIAMMSLSGRT